MQKIVSATQMREIDRLTTERYAIPSLLLMEAAASAAARNISAHFGHDLSHRTVQVLCGQGNNGGDGAALARALWLLGARVDVILFGRVEETKGDARTNFDIARQLASFAAGSSAVPPPLVFTECEDVGRWEALASERHGYEIIVDALFGTGLTRPLEGIFSKVVAHLELMRAARMRAGRNSPLIVSLDIPSGINADSAALIGDAVTADLTVTFTAPKPANVLPPASHAGGQLVVANIGSPAPLVEAADSKLYLVEADDVRAWLASTRYAPDSHKFSHGSALIIAGSRDMMGAAVMCGNAAMRSGAGVVSIASPASALPGVAARLTPAIMTASLPETAEGSISADALVRVSELAGRATVVAVGPGLTKTEETRRFVRGVVERRTTPTVIDADALNALAPWPADLRGTPAAPLILTPHDGEMRRLLGTDNPPPLEDRARIAGEFATAHELILVLKGTRTLIAAPDGRVFVNPTGNAGLGTAGSGDTLTGIITGFIAQAFATFGEQADAVAATIAAVYVQGLAGDLAVRERGKRALVAPDIPEYFGAAMRSLDAAGESI